MFKLKRFAMLLLVFVMVVMLVFAVASCTNGEPLGDAEEPAGSGSSSDESAAEPTPAPPIDEPIAVPVPPIEENLDEEDFIVIEVPDAAITVNGRVIPGTSLEAFDGSNQPTHASLWVLGSALEWDVYWQFDTGDVSFMGVDGFIHFIVGSKDYKVGDTVIKLAHESVRVDDEVYVPIEFFKEVFGAERVELSNGHLYIDYTSIASF